MRTALMFVLGVSLIANRAAAQLPGDLDGSDSISISELHAAELCLASPSDNQPPQCNPLLDTNGDGIVDMDDLMKMGSSPPGEGPCHPFGWLGSNQISNAYTGYLKDYQFGVFGATTFTSTAVPHGVCLNVVQGTPVPSKSLWFAGLYRLGPYQLQGHWEWHWQQVGLGWVLGPFDGDNTGHDGDLVQRQILYYEFYSFGASPLSTTVVVPNQITTPEQFLQTQVTGDAVPTYEVCWNADFAVTHRRSQQVFDVFSLGWSNRGAWLSEIDYADNRAPGSIASKCHFQDCLYSPGQSSNWLEVPLDTGYSWASYPDVYKLSQPFGPSEANNFDVWDVRN